MMQMELFDNLELLQRLDAAIARTTGEPQRRLIKKRSLVESGDYVVRDVTSEIITEAARVIGDEISRWTKVYLTANKGKQALAFKRQRGRRYNGVAVA